MSYAIFAPAGLAVASTPQQRTTQEFQLDDDLGDGRASALGYGGRIRPAQFRTAGAIWAAAGTPVRWRCSRMARARSRCVLDPDEAGDEERDLGAARRSGPAPNTTPLILEFTAEREGYHQAERAPGRCGRGADPRLRQGRIRAPAESEKF